MARRVVRHLHWQRSTFSGTCSREQFADIAHARAQIHRSLVPLSIERPVDASIAIANPRRPLMPDRSVGIGVAARARETNIAGRSSHSLAKTNRMSRAMNGVDRY